jgi:PHP family Zn ribbon phosphoesterase
VQYRVDELADRPDGFMPKGALPYKKLLPLNELISAVIGSPLASKKVAAEYGKLIAAFKAELSILIDVPAESLSKISGEKIVAAIIANREGKLVVSPGFDGEYGQITSFGKEANPKAKKAVVPNLSLASQKSLDQYC